MASDWTYHFSHAWKNIVRDSDWTYQFFHVWKPSFAPLIGQNSVAYENLQHSFLVSISQYVYNKLIYIPILACSARRSYILYWIVHVKKIKCLLLPSAHLFDFWYINNSCVNTVRQHFPWSILYIHFLTINLLKPDLVMWLLKLMQSWTASVSDIRLSEHWNKTFSIFVTIKACFDFVTQLFHGSLLSISLSFAILKLFLYGTVHSLCFIPYSPCFILSL